MANHGFLKTISGVKRLRIAKPGNDATNLSLNKNLLVFDSEAASSFPVWRSGVYTVTAAQSHLALDTWPDLGFIPLILWEVSKSTFHATWFGTSNASSTDILLYTKPTGLYLNCFGSVNYPIDVVYVVIRRPVA